MIVPFTFLKTRPDLKITKKGRVALVNLKNTTFRDIGGKIRFTLVFLKKGPFLKINIMTPSQFQITTYF